MASSTGGERQPVRGGKAMSWLSRVFELNPPGLNWGRAVMVLDVMLVPLVVFLAFGHGEYLLSAAMGAVFSVLIQAAVVPAVIFGTLILPTKFGSTVAPARITCGTA